MTKSLFLFLLLFSPKPSLDLSKADEIIKIEKMARKDLGNMVDLLDKALERENPTEIFVLTHAVDQNMRFLLSLQIEALEFSKALRVETEKKFQRKEISLEEKEMRLSRAKELENISNFSLKYVSGKLATALKRIEFLVKCKKQRTA